MKVFLTGGTGFIGSHILMRLIYNGHHVTVLARNKNKIPELNRIKNLEIIEGDIGDLKLIREIVKGHDACIHVALFWGEPGGYNMLNADTAASVNLCDAASDAGCKQFIYTSSTAVDDYFYMVPENQREDKSKFISISKGHKPATYYGATKAATEDFLLAASYETSMKINIIRPGYTFGNPALNGAPIQSDKRFLTIAVNAKKGTPIEVTKNDGTQFIWADDLAEIYIKLLTANLNRKVYFGLSKNFVSWESIANTAVKMAGSASKIVITDAGYSDQPVLFDVSDIEKDFNLVFDPTIRIREHLDFYLK
jgi:UDP-glucose 4-epimerase